MNDAIRAHSNDPELLIQPVEITINAKAGEGSFDITVMDNVGGISDRWLLEETYPGSGRQNVTRLNVSRRLQDTGLGIAKMYQAARALGGKLHLCNIDAEGNELALKDFDKRAGFKIKVILPESVVVEEATDEPFFGAA